MNTITLYHGTLDKAVTPTYGLGDDKHDYGRGFYLTEDIELAKEWSVCRPEEENGWVHKFELDIDGLKVFDFQEHDILVWLAELMKHRAGDDSKRYRVLSAKFIEKYGVDMAGYDIVKGWRANASYFFIAKEFVRDDIDVNILEDLLHLGGLGIQYCLKSEKAYSRLKEIEEGLMPVDYATYNRKYNLRDKETREHMRELVNSDANRLINVFSTLI